MTLALITFLAALLFAAPLCAADIRVIDGDTIEIGSKTFRLHGVDAPEAGQNCAALGGGTWSCGEEATTALIELIAGRAVSCDRRDTDRYGRLIGVCTADGRDLNAAMVASGLAGAYRRFSDDHALEEDAARAAGRGVWRDDRASMGASQDALERRGFDGPGRLSDQGQHLAEWTHLPCAMVALVFPHQDRLCERRALVLRRARGARGRLACAEPGPVNEWSDPGERRTLRRGRHPLAGRRLADDHAAHGIISA